MSVDIIQPTSMQPMKRARESISLSEDNVSKCGELFVTNCADKWTFYCTYCQKATTDIGVFICHIRLEHLNEQQDFQQPSRPPIPILEGNVCTVIASSSLQTERNLDGSATSTPVASSLHSEELTANTEQETEISHIVKEETRVAISQENIEFEPICTTVSKVVDITALTEPASNGTEDDDISNKNATTATANATDDEWDEEFLALTATDYETEERNKQIIEVVFRNDDETIKQHKANSTNDSQQREANDSATDSVNTASEDDETNDDQQTQLKTNTELHPDPTASGSRRRKPLTEHELKIKANRELLPHKCQICQLGFKSRQGVHFHISKIHDKDLHTRLPHKCAVCDRGFKTVQGLKYHKVIHESKAHYKCAICPMTQFKLNIFINHVLTHESDSCFPCQVCGKIYASNEERMLHWKSHAKERPFGCNICFRRFRKQQYLTHHLKAHNLYQCHFCPYEFNSTETQRPPYVCTKCEELPDIKQKVKHLRSLAEKTHVFDSDED